MATERISNGEDLARLSVELAPSGMIAIDAEGTILLVNREVERLFGYTREELVGHSIEIFVPSRFRGAHPGYRSNYLMNPQTRPMGVGRELFGVRKDGTEVPVEIGLNPVATPAGMRIFASIVNITERRRAEQELRESEHRFRLLVERVQGYAVFTLDAAGRISSWNAGAERIMGWRGDEILGKPYGILFPEDERREGRPELILSRAASDGRLEEEARRAKKDGQTFLASVLITALDDGRGRPRGFIEFARDITAERQFDDRLRQSQKMEAIGTLAGGIAHDFNNILAGIVGYGELVREAVADRREAVADVNCILAAADRGKKLVQRILTFSRRRESALSAVRLEGVVREALLFLRASLPKTIEIRESYDVATPRVLADDTQIHQVLINLATNSSHAMAARGGTLDVSIAPYLADEDFARAHPRAREGLYARIRVKDSGCGIPEDVLARAVEPFFTTKAVGAGTGLGLSVVHGIVEAHNGVFDIRSRVGDGTTVDVYLPPLEADKFGAATAVVATSDSKKHVLVVEDEPLLAELARRQIQALGYRVTTHTSSLQALEEFRANPGAFDLVVTDNTMPWMTGLQLAEEVLRIRPGMPILMVSGIGDAMDGEELKKRGIRRVLAKPAHASDLEKALREIVGDA